jgi:acetyl-CoA carboxylase biotin carboxyl carrier protein
MQIQETSMELERIEKLIDLLKDKEVGELEYSEWEGEQGFNIRVSLAGQVAVTTTTAPAAPAAPAADALAAATEATEGDAHHVQVSPMVGTFYRSPSPEASVFVELGDRVQVGQTLCIVEAMKLMNEIEADAAGIVEAILVDNANPVQFGQPLFKIREE